MRATVKSHKRKGRVVKAHTRNMLGSKTQGGMAFPNGAATGLKPLKEATASKKDYKKPRLVSKTGGTSLPGHCGTKKGCSSKKK